MLAVILAMVLGTEPAAAGWKIDRATAIAAKVWHEPCDGDVGIVWADEPIAEFARAWADWHGCRVFLLADSGPTPWHELCTIMIHEYGHLARYQDPRNVADPWHSTNPRSVMRANVEYDVLARRGRIKHVEGADRRCLDRGRPYLGMAPAGQGWG